MNRRLRILVFTLLIMAGMTLALPALAATKSVKLTADNQFSPGNVSVAVGDSVEFNWGGGFHDVVFADGAKSGAPTADTGVLYSRTFDTAGTFKYVCSVHEASGMTGAITVAATGGTTATTTAATGDSSGDTTETRSMPSTGPEGAVIPLLGGVLVMAGIAGLVIVRRLES